MVTWLLIPAYCSCWGFQISLPSFYFTLVNFFSRIPVLPPSLELHKTIFFGFAETHWLLCFGTKSSCPLEFQSTRNLSAAPPHLASPTIYFPLFNDGGWIYSGASEHISFTSQKRSTWKRNISSVFCTVLYHLLTGFMFDLCQSMSLLSPLIN